MSRICPTCHRLFTLGDILSDHAEDEKTREIDPMIASILAREQSISGICASIITLSCCHFHFAQHYTGSPVCFVLACYAHPNAIKAAWGCTIDEIDDHTWEMLNSAGEATEAEEGLGYLVRMTRLDDLGLDQMIRL